MHRKNYGYAEEIEFLSYAKMATSYFYERLKEMEHQKLNDNIKCAKETIEYLEWKIDRMDRNIEMRGL